MILLCRLARDRDEQVEPVPDDEQVQGVKWVVVVEETGDRVRFPHLATVLGNEDYWNAWEERGVQMRPYDADSPDAKPYLEAAKAAGLPAILLIGEGGKVLKAKSMPASVAGVTELLTGK